MFIGGSILIAKFPIDEWRMIEEDFDLRPGFAESIFSLDNEHMGLRGFLKRIIQDSLEGTYGAGVFYPDKTKVGWRKNGYPEFFPRCPILQIGLELESA